jgi:hypothetical protein
MFHVRAELHLETLGGGLSKGKIMDDVALSIKNEAAHILSSIDSGIVLQR